MTYGRFGFAEGWIERAARRPQVMASHPLSEGRGGAPRKRKMHEPADER
jgi:hypothetical protein